MKTFSEREDELCQLLAWLSCHVDEDVEQKSEDVKEYLEESVAYLEKIGWYDFNAQRGRNNGPTL